MKDLSIIEGILEWADNPVLRNDSEEFGAWRLPVWQIICEGQRYGKIT